MNRTWHMRVGLLPTTVSEPLGPATPTCGHHLLCEPFEVWHLDLDSWVETVKVIALLVGKYPKDVGALSLCRRPSRLLRVATERC